MPRNTRFLPHPSRGGLRGYDIPFRQMVLNAYWAGTPPPEGMLSSVKRWNRNGIVPLRMTGNKPSSALSGQSNALAPLPHNRRRRHNFGNKYHRRRPLLSQPQAVVRTHRRQRPVTILPSRCCRMDQVFQREGNVAKCVKIMVSRGSMERRGIFSSSPTQELADHGDTTSPSAR